MLNKIVNDLETAIKDLNSRISKLDENNAHDKEFILYYRGMVVAFRAVISGKINNDN